MIGFLFVQLLYDVQLSRFNLSNLIKTPVPFTHPMHPFHPSHVTQSGYLKSLSSLLSNTNYAKIPSKINNAAAADDAVPASAATASLVPPLPIDPVSALWTHLARDVGTMRHRIVVWALCRTSVVVEAVKERCLVFVREERYRGARLGRVEEGSNRALAVEDGLEN